MNTHLIDWDSPTWGQPGHNTHEATTDDLGKPTDKHRDDTGDQ